MARKKTEPIWLVLLAGAGTVLIRICQVIIYEPSEFISKSQFLSCNFRFFIIMYRKTLNNEYIERIHQMSYSSLSDNGLWNVADIKFIN